MKVKELIDILQKIDGNFEVVIQNEFGHLKTNELIVFHLHENSKYVALNDIHGNQMIARLQPEYKDELKANDCKGVVEIF